MSLDGYIAGQNGEFDWILMDPDMDFSQMMGRFDTVLLGRKTYEASKTHGGAMPGIKAFVFSNTLSENECQGATLSHDPAKTVSELREKEGKDIWLFGGGIFFKSMLESKLVDSIELAIIPVLLGSGLPMLPLSDIRHKLKLDSHTIYPKTGTVLLTYNPV